MTGIKKVVRNATTRPDVSSNAGLNVESLTESCTETGDLTRGRDEPDHKVGEPAEKESAGEATDHCAPQRDFKTHCQSASSRFKAFRNGNPARVIQAADDQECEWNESENSCLAEGLNDRVMDHERALGFEVVGRINREGDDRAIDADSEQRVRDEHCHTGFDRRNPLLIRVVLIADAVTSRPGSSYEGHPSRE